jgi:hypothetical protein
MDAGLSDQQIKEEVGKFRRFVRRGRTPVSTFFKGVMSRDKLPLHPTPGAYVLNMQGANEGDKKGTHWVLLIVTRHGSAYFDSYGVAPPLEILDRAPKPLKIMNSRQLQMLSDTSCGWFVLYVIFQTCVLGKAPERVARLFAPDAKKNDELVRGRQLLSD